MDLLRTRPAVPEWSPSSASLHPKPISDSPHRMSWSEQAESCSAQLTTAPPPPSPPLFHPSILSTLPLLCAQPRDLICLVISGLACSAQLHSKVKLDKGIGASPCKTASPWQLLEWAADCRRVEEEGREEKCVGGRRMYLRGRQTPIHFSLFRRGDLCQGREPATKTEAVQSEDKAPGATGDQLSTQQHAGACPVCPVSFQWDPDR